MGIAQDIIGRLRMAFSAGFQMNGMRDLYQTFGWRRVVLHQDFIGKFLRQDITQRIITAPVNALWSDPPTVTGDPPFQAAWQDLLAKIPVFHELQRADTLAGLGKYSILVIGFDDGQQLDQPINGRAKRSVIYLQPYAEGSVDIKTFDEVQTSPRFGLPLMYRVTPGAFTMGTNATVTAVSDVRSAFDVHYSRVLHIAEGALESKVFGHSRLEAVYNVLDDIMKVTGGSAEMFWLSANRGLHVNVDKDMELKKEDAEDLSEEIDEYTNELRRVIRTRGVEVKSLGSEVADPRGVFDVQCSLLAATTGIPKRVLMGSEAGQLASQQDRANWAIRVEERIQAFGQPIVLIPFIRLLIDGGVLPVPQQMSIEWPDAFKMNPLERAQTSAQMARSAANLSKTLKTVQDINTAAATNARPTFEPLSGGGGMFGNAKKPPSVPPKTTGSVPNAPPTPAPTPGEGSATSDPSTVPDGMLERPPLIPDFVPLVLLTEEECRQIIGFGKHMPVFDDTKDSTASGSQPGGE